MDTTKESIMDNTIASNTTVVNTFPKIGYFIILITLGLVGSQLNDVTTIWDYAFLAPLCITSFILLRVCWQQKVIFGDSKVSFIKMQQNSDFSLPTTLSLHYQDIDSVRLLGDHLFIHSAKGKVNFPLRPKSTLAKKLKQTFEAKGIEFEVNSCIL
ncbi:hypothetical protein TUM4438_15940 [Shewanella sairae]|uniref:YcxB family protein n=2 Tax=Shewanella sairae TaxID=190310 RepID=A0ABQ4PAW4_9GAMM|nr:hypothetical protein TUM4438_15940 [Shewanella sairae]